MKTILFQKKVNLYFLFFCIAYTVNLYWYEYIIFINFDWGLRDGACGLEVD